MAVGREHIVPLHLAENGAAQELYGFGGLRDRDGKGREEEVAEAAGDTLLKGDEFSGRKDFEQQAEKIGQQDAEEKGGHRHQDLVDGDADLPKGLALIAHQRNAERQAQRRDQDPAHHGQHRRYPHLAAQHLVYRHGIAVARPHVAAQKGSKPAQIAYKHIAVEAHGLAQGLGALGGIVAPEQHGGGIAGDNFKGEKCKQGYQEQGRNQYPCFLEYILHRLILPGTWSRDP